MKRVVGGTIKKRHRSRIDYCCNKTEIIISFHSSALWNHYQNVFHVVALCLIGTTKNLRSILHQHLWLFESLCFSRSSCRPMLSHRLWEVPDILPLPLVAVATNILATE